VSTDTDVAGSNPYSPPLARVADASGEHAAAFYVVAPWKLLVMTIGTATLYSVYWFYKNWALLNRRDQAYWPVPRAIFAVFFTHSLFDEIDARLRRSGSAHTWSPRVLATVYVVCLLVRGFDSRLAPGVFDPGRVALFNLLMMTPMIFVLYRAQRAINVAENDPAGASNARLSVANALWLVLGLLWWTVIGLGIFLMLTGRIAR